MVSVMRKFLLLECEKLNIPVKKDYSDERLLGMILSDVQYRITGKSVKDVKKKKVVARLKK